MIPSSGSTLVLIIDEDLGFLMWLGELFAELGCQAMPALHCRQGLALAKQLKLPITILIANPELRGYQQMVRLLTAANPGLRVIPIRDSTADGKGVRSDGAARERRAYWSGLYPGKRFPARNGWRKFASCFFWPRAVNRGRAGLRCILPERAFWF